MNAYLMAMKIELTQSLHSALHTLIERLLDAADWMIFRKKVTVSEGSLFALCAVRSVWYLAHGITADAGVIAFVLPNIVWIIVFPFLTILHIVAFFSPTTYSRGLTCGLYAFIWAFLAILSVWAPFNSPASPTFFVFALLSAFVSARLIREAHRKNDPNG